MDDAHVNATSNLGDTHAVARLGCLVWCYELTESKVSAVVVADKLYALLCGGVVR